MPGAGSTAAAPAGPVSRGFIVTLRCVTPYGGGTQDGRAALQFVQSEFVDKLTKIKAAGDPDRRYEVARAAIVSANKVEDDQAKLTQIQAAWMAVKGSQAAGAGTVRPGGTTPPYNMVPGGFGGAYPTMPGMVPTQPPAGAAGAAAAAENPFVDLLTEEDVRQDREFTILLAVVLHDQAPSTPAASAADGAGQGK